MAKPARYLSLLGMVLVSALLVPTAQAQIGVSITVEPPALPVYEQPPIPEPGYIWTPGYWAYGPEGYFWVPGTWILPPQPGLLWTPGFWAWSGGAFLWNGGYWGPQIGFYGGVNYGFGYPGHGYEGGYWRDNRFFYNRTVNNITNVQVTNVYSKTVVNNVTVNRVSYVGGTGGLQARPTAAEQEVAHQNHIAPTSVQTAHRDGAAQNHQLLASVNQGKPPIAATSKPNDFTTHVITASKAGGPLPAADRKPASAATAVTPAGASAATHVMPAGGTGSNSGPIHARDLPKTEPTPAPAESASAEEKAYAQQQSTVLARQSQEREALAQQQDRDHANAATQANHAQQAAEMEHQHQQQTAQLQQRHAVERESIPKPAPHAAAAPPHEGSH